VWPGNALHWITRQERIRADNQRRPRCRWSDFPPAACTRSGAIHCAWKAAGRFLAHGLYQFQSPSGIQARGSAAGHGPFDFIYPRMAIQADPHPRAHCQGPVLPPIDKTEVAAGSPSPDASPATLAACRTSSLAEFCDKHTVQAKGGVSQLSRRVCKGAQGAVRTIDPQTQQEMVRTLRFAHPTIFPGEGGRS